MENDFIQFENQERIVIAFLAIVFTFAFLSSFNHAITPLTSASVGKALFVYYTNATSTSFYLPKMRFFYSTNASWSGESSIIAAGTSGSGNNGTGFRWVEVRANPIKDEYIAVFATNETLTRIYAMVYNGSDNTWCCFKNLSTTAGIGGTTKTFDVEYLSNGTALVVYSNGTNGSMPFITWNNGWGTEQSIGQGINYPIWLDLATDPSSLNASLVTADSRETQFPINGTIFNGTAWTAGTRFGYVAFPLTTGADSQGKVLATCFEGTSSRAVVGFSNSTGATSYVVSANWTGSAWSATTNNPVTFSPSWIDCKQRKQDNNIIFTDWGDFQGADVNDFEVSLWNGTNGMQGFVLVDSATEKDMTTGSGGTAFWVGNTANLTILGNYVADADYLMHNNCDTNVDAGGDGGACAGAADYAPNLAANTGNPIINTTTACAGDAWMPKAVSDPFSNDSLVVWIGAGAGIGDAFDKNFSKCSAFYSGGAANFTAVTSIDSDGQGLGNGSVYSNRHTAYHFDVSWKEYVEPQFQWQNFNKTNGTAFNSETVQFFVNFSNNTALDKVVINVNGTNTTMTQWNYSVDWAIYNVNLSLGAGTWYFNYTANDTSGGSNMSSNFQLNIIQNSTWIMNMSLNSTPANLTSTWAASANATCFFNTADSMDISIYENGTSIVGSPLAKWVSALSNLPVGTRNFTCVTSGNANYSAKSNQTFAFISKGQSNVSLFLNGTHNNASYTYPQTINASAFNNWTFGNVTLYRNSTGLAFGILSAESSNATLAAKTWNYTACFDEDANVSASCTTFFGFVAQNSTWLLNHTLNMSPSNLSGTYAATAWVNCTQNTLSDQLTLTEYLNSTSIASGSSISASVNLPAGTTNFTCYTAGNENYSGIIENQSFAFIAKSSVNVSVWINGTNNNNASFIYPQTVNATGTHSAGSEGNITIYLNSSGIAFDTTIATSLNLSYKVATWNWTGCYPESQNYSASCRYQYAFFSKNSTWQMNHTLNGSSLNLTSTFRTAVNQSCTANSESGQATLNITENSTSTGSGASFWIHLSNVPAGTRNFTCFSDGNENYTALAENQTFAFISKATPSMTLHLNSSTSNQTYNVSDWLNQTANATQILNQTEGEARLYRNGTLISNTTLDTYSIANVSNTFNYTTVFNETQNYSNYSITFYSFVLQNINDCGNVSTSYTVTRNQTNFTGICFNITASNVNLNGAGFWIYNNVSNPASTTGVMSNATYANNTIRNFKFLNLSIGIDAEGSVNLTIRDNYFNSTTNVTNAIYLNGVSNTTIINNTVEVIGSYFAGQTGLGIGSDAVIGLNVSYSNFTCKLTVAGAVTGACVYLQNSPSNATLHDLYINKTSDSSGGGTEYGLYFNGDTSGSLHTIRRVQVWDLAGSSSDEAARLSGNFWIQDSYFNDSLSENGTYFRNANGSIVNSTLNTRAQFETTGAYSTVINSFDSNFTTQINFPDYTSNLTRYFTSTVNVTTISSLPISGANVTVRDVNGTISFSELTGVSGFTSAHNVSMDNRSKVGIFNNTPTNFTATAAGYTDNSTNYTVSQINLYSLMLGVASSSGGAGSAGYGSQEDFTVQPFIAGKKRNIVDDNPVLQNRNVSVESVYLQNTGGRGLTFKIYFEYPSATSLKDCKVDELVADVAYAPAQMFFLNLGEKVRVETSCTIPTAAEEGQNLTASMIFSAVSPLGEAHINKTVIINLQVEKPQTGIAELSVLPTSNSPIAGSWLVLLAAILTIAIGIYVYHSEYQRLW